MIGTSRDQVVVALLFVGRHLLDVALREVRSEGAGLTTAETALLLTLRAFPASSQTDLVHIVGRDKTTLSRTVSRLESAGFLTERIDPVDGRRKTLELTDRAQGIVVQALEAVTEQLDRAAASLSPDQEIACLRLIEELMGELSVV